MMSLKSNYFHTRDELCDFVNNNETVITVVQIIAQVLLSSIKRANNA